jgi:hypothetical protein
LAAEPDLLPHRITGRVGLRLVDPGNGVRTAR